MIINQNQKTTEESDFINKDNSSIKYRSLSNLIKDDVDSFSLYNNKFKYFKETSPYSDMNDHFLCTNCKKVPILEFISLEFANYSCSCYSADNVKIDEIFIKNIKKDEEDENEKTGNIQINNLERYLKCQTHLRNFVYYCQICKEDLCRDCFRKVEFHQNHTLYNFDINFLEIKNKKQHIDEILYNNKNTYIDEFLKDEEKEIILSKFINLLSVIYNDFIGHPNYSHIIIIDNAAKYLDKFIANKDNNIIIENLQLTKQIKINSKKILLENINNAEIIVEIDIYRSNLNDITELCKLNLINLKKLYLFENCITNIKPLINVKFKYLEKLNLGSNKLGNDSIPILYELKFEKLIELNLYLNNFTDSNIFKFKNNKDCLPKLEIFYIGSNLIDWNINNTQNEIKYDLSSLTTIGLTNGIFYIESIFYIKRFIFTKLEILFLSRNNFKSLAFVEKLELPNIKQFSIHTSYINEFYPLIKYKTLKVINMKENCISKIDKLKQFVEQLTMLKELDIRGNNIDINDENNKEIITYFYNKKDINSRHFDLYI